MTNYDQFSSQRDVNSTLLNSSKAPELNIILNRIDELNRNSLNMCQFIKDKLNMILDKRKPEKENTVPPTPINSIVETFWYQLEEQQKISSLLSDIQQHLNEIV